MHRLRTPIAILLGALIALAETDVAFGDSPNVTAVLSNSEAVVGETVQLQIKVSIAGDAKPPEQVGFRRIDCAKKERLCWRNRPCSDSARIRSTRAPKTD